MTVSMSAEFVAEARAIDDARIAAFEALAAAIARGFTSDDFDDLEITRTEIEARCEQLRRRFYPRRHRLVITGGEAMTMSPSGRSCPIVWIRGES